MSSFNRVQYTQIFDMCVWVYSLCANQRKRGKGQCIIPNAQILGNRARAIAIEAEQCIGQLGPISASLWKEL